MVGTAADARRRAHEALKKAGAIRDCDFGSKRFGPRPLGIPHGPAPLGLPWAAWIEVDGRAHAVQRGATREAAKRALLSAVGAPIPSTRESKKHEGMTKVLGYVGDVVNIVSPAIPHHRWPKGYTPKQLLTALGKSARRMRNDLRVIESKGGTVASEILESLIVLVAHQFAEASTDEQWRAFDLHRIRMLLDVLSKLPGPQWRELVRTIRPPDLNRAAIGRAFPAIKAAWESMGWEVVDSDNSPFVKITNAALRHAGVVDINIRSFIRARPKRK